VKRLIALGALLLLAFACDAFDPYADLPTEGEALQEAIARAQRDCRLWLEALEAFRQDYGRYPSGREGLALLVRNPDPNVYPDWNGPYGPANDALLRDPWDHPYHLESTDTEVAVVSDGVDRRPHTGNEIREAVEVSYH
jgi:Type II secretion system (T2SS), protein G